MEAHLITIVKSVRQSKTKETQMVEPANVWHENSDWRD